MINLVLGLLLSIANISFAQKIYVLKQWHLPPKVDTTEIATAKKLAQYKNQKDLYQKVSALIEKNSVKVLLSEGCEKVEIDKSFVTKFNGWNYAQLEKTKSKKNYVDILTLLPLKVEVFFTDKVKTLCVDNDELIHKSQLALSDIRAYVGYASRLEEFKQKKDQVSFDRYAKSLLTPEQIAKKVDALKVAKEMALIAVEEFEKINQAREGKFVENIVALNMDPKESIAIIIGGVHAEKLSNDLKKHKWVVEMYTPSGYVDNDKGLLEDVKRKLQ